MSLHNAAQHLASKGRGPDTELVHMTKGEIASLQSLAQAHGGSLTVNPKTGLPEAGFLESILPAVVGGATAVFAPWALPYVAAGMGALAWDKSGDPMKGLAAGLGAYGGGQLAGGIAGLGADATATAIGNSATATGDMAAEEAAKNALAQQQAATMNANMWDSVGAQARPNFVSPEVAAQSARDYEANAFGNTYELTGGYRPTFGPADAYAPGAGPAITPDAVKLSGQDLPAAQRTALYSPFSTGLKEAISDPSKLSGIVDRKTLAMAGAPLIAAALTPKTRSAAPTTKESGIGDYQSYSFTPGVASPFPQANPRGVEQNYFPGMTYNKISQADSKALYGYAGGGDIQGNDPSDTQGDPNLQNVRSYDPVVRMKGGGDLDKYLYAGLDSDTAWDFKQAARNAPTKPKLADEGPMKKPARLSDMPGLESGDDLRKTKGLYATGGLSDLGGYSDGGRLLRGPGDGVSDSIPATISNKRPARLADGEFVVPARIVSELGNGSTEAGARQLYAMMDRVQKARGKTTGKDKVAKNTRAAKYLPA